MTIKVEIKNPGVEPNIAKVGNEGDILVSNTGIPPILLNVALKPFAEFMLDSTGSKDARVAGTLAAPIDFVIGSSSEGNRYIHSMAFTIADAGATLNKFGNIAALTNGCQLIYEDNILGEVIIGDLLKSNFDFVQLCGFNPSFGDGTAAFRASNVEGASEAYVPILKSELYGLKNGLLIPKDSTKKVILRIRDPLGAIDRFDVKVFGFDRIER